MSEENSKRLADEQGLKTEEITLFAKELEEKLSKFDSFFQIPDETFDKVTILYDRLCKVDKLNYQLQQLMEYHESYVKAVRFIGDEEKLKEVLKNVKQFIAMARLVNIEDGTLS